MSAISPPPQHSDITSRLRAAGCVFAEDEARLLIEAARTPSELNALLERRVRGTPLEFVLGWAEFCGLRIALDFGVFVPRRRTEFLVRHAITLAKPRPVVVDLCCGSGAVGLALATAVEQVALYAVDIDPVSVACARQNIAAVGGLAFAGDLYDPLPLTVRGRVDLLVANAPYVPTDSLRLLPPEARDHEPHVALDGGPDGLDVVRRVATGAASWLAPGGCLLIETSQAQAPRALEALTRGGLIARMASSEALNCTVAIGTMPTS